MPTTHAVVKAPNCYLLLRQEHLARYLTLEEYVAQAGYHVEYENNGDIVRVVNREGIQVAYIEVRLNSKLHDTAPNYISVRFMEVKDSLRGTLMGTSLLGHMVRRYPDASGVYSVMAGDDRRAIETELANGATLNEAIAATPFYKAARAIGYGKISERSQESTVYLDYVVPPLRRR